VTYRVDLDRSAQKALKALDGSIRSRVVTALRALADEPRPSGCVKLTNREAWRIRIGDYRVVYEIRDAILVVKIIDLGHRSDIYR